MLQEHFDRFIEFSIKKNAQNALVCFSKRFNGPVLHLFIEPTSFMIDKRTATELVVQIGQVCVEYKNMTIRNDLLYYYVVLI